MSDDNLETRQGRREKRAEKRKERMLKHGKNLAKTYRDATLKRLKGENDKKQG